jgi:hypothetical protein
MIKIEKTAVYGWEAAIRGMRNPKNSWAKSDTKYHDIDGIFDVPKIGPNDHELMMKLAKAGSVHAKYRRQIFVSVDITAPFYWWKEFDTYKVGTTSNSCSTMHKIHAKEFTFDDFSCEHLNTFNRHLLGMVINNLNTARASFNETKDKDAWWQMIQILPTSYNQTRTITLDYEVLVGMYRDRKNHKLDEWHVLCDWIKALPYSEIITLEEKTDGET